MGSVRFQKLIAPVDFVSTITTAVASDEGESPEIKFLERPSAEASQLEREVLEIAGRLAERRAKVLNELTKGATDQIAALRPLQEETEQLVSSSDFNAATASEGTAPSERPADIRARFSQVAGRLPALRARLERMILRMERVLRAADPTTPTKARVNVTPTVVAHMQKRRRLDVSARKWLSPSARPLSPQEPAADVFNPLSSPDTHVATPGRKLPATPPPRVMQAEPQPSPALKVRAALSRSPAHRRIIVIF